MTSNMTGNTLKLYQLFLTHKELTDIELLQMSDLNPNSIRPTRLNLERAKLIRKTNRKKNHNTSKTKNTKYTIYEIIEQNPKPTDNQKTILLVIDKIQSLTHELANLINLLK